MFTRTTNDEQGPYNLNADPPKEKTRTLVSNPDFIMQMQKFIKDKEAFSQVFSSSSDDDEEVEVRLNPEDQLGSLAARKDERK